MDVSYSLVSRIILVSLLSFLCLGTYAQQDSAKAKQKVVFKSARLYKGVAIESITPNDERTIIVVKTIDGNDYFLTPEELKQALDITLGSKGWMLPKDAHAVYYDQNGVPSESYQKDEYTNVNDKTPTRVYTEKRNVPSGSKIIYPFYILDGKDATPQQLQQLNPNDVFSINVLKPDSAIKIYGDKGKDGIVIIITKKLKEDISHPKVEKSAQFPGGLDGWRRYLEQNLHYPQAAQEHNTQGIIRVQMVVDKTGKITEVTALNDPGDGLADEAVRVIKTGPDWIPAVQDGMPVTYKFVQTITFKIGTRTIEYLPVRTNNYNQNIIIKTARLYNGKTVESIIPTYDLKGADVMTTDGKTFFVNREECMQQFGLIINDKEFVAPEDARVLYYDNNAAPSDNYLGLKFIGGKRNFPISLIYLRGTKNIDITKQPVFVLNGKEATAEEIQQVIPYHVKGSNLLKLQDEPALAKFGSSGKNGILFISTKIPYPDNYLYLLNNKETSNEELGKLRPGVIKRMVIYTGKKAEELYGEKAHYGVVVADTNTVAASNLSGIAFSKLQEPATFPGGDEGWKKYIANNLRYPQAALKNKTEATVRIDVTIAADGTVKYATPYNNPGDGLAQEAVRLLKESPKWIPAKYKGQNVIYRFVVPITFKLESTNYF